MKFISLVDSILSWIERSIIVAFLGVMVVLAFLQVVLRNLFSFGFLWADPLLRYLVVWVGFVGASVATRQEKHFGIEFLNRYLSPRALHIVKSVVDAFASGVAVLLAIAAYQFLAEGIGADEMDLFGLPKRLYYAVLPIGFGMIGLRFALHVVRHIGNAITGAGRSPADTLPPEAIV